MTSTASEVNKVACVVAIVSSDLFLDYAMNSVDKKASGRRAVVRERNLLDDRL